MKLPKSFKLAGMDFKVEIVESVNDGNDYGNYSDVTNTIKIATKLKEDGKWVSIPEKIMLNTFLHELFHVLQYYYNNEYNEAQAQVYANFIMEYLQTVTYGETFD